MILRPDEAIALDGRRLLGAMGAAPSTRKVIP
jgi:hypothetical protein